MFAQRYRFFVVVFRAQILVDDAPGARSCLPGSAHPTATDLVVTVGTVESISSARCNKTERACAHSNAQYLSILPVHILVHIFVFLLLRCVHTMVCAVQ